MAKKTDIFYSLLNVTNASVLSAKLNGVQYDYTGKREKIERRRNWKLSQFQIFDEDVLEYFVNAKPIDDKHYYNSIGTEEIWVKEEEIDKLYMVIALSVLRHFCGYDKQKALFGAFLFSKDPQLFISESIEDPEKIMEKLKVGLEFLTWLDTFGVLSFAKSSFSHVNGTWVKAAEERHFFSIGELELISKERQDIKTIFLWEKEKPKV